MDNLSDFFLTDEAASEFSTPYYWYILATDRLWSIRNGCITFSLMMIPNCVSICSFCTCRTLWTNDSQVMIWTYLMIYWMKTLDPIPGIKGINKSCSWTSNITTHSRERFLSGTLHEVSWMGTLVGNLSDQPNELRPNYYHTIVNFIEWYILDALVEHLY